MAAPCRKHFTWKGRDLKRLGLLCLIVLLTAVPLWAIANHADVRDTNDTQGLLDVRFVKVTGEDKPRWEFITFGEWTKERIWDRGYALVYFDTSGDKRFDKYALVRSTGLTMEGSLWRDRKTKADVKIANLDVFRRDQRSVVVKVPFGELDIPEQRDFYRWFAETLFSGNPCPRICIDRVPDKGAIFEPLGEATPTPTITPTPMPTLTVSPSPTPTQSP